MQKVLIFGASGMLVHKAWQIFRSYCDTYVTLKGPFSRYAHYNLFDKEHAFDNVDVSQPRLTREIIEQLKPDVVFNCAGVIKQSPLGKNPLEAIEINALFPHSLAQICNKLDIRLIHISTDCVFSGKKGSYTESDHSDAEDLYGKTKFLGEVSYGKALTLRTSMIGHELNSQLGLLEWFLSQADKRVKGYTKAIFSGFTTKVFCGIILDIIRYHRNLCGLYHVSSEPISKFELLSLIKEIYKLNIELEPDNQFICNRSLDSTHFCRITKFSPPSWREMVVDMYRDCEFYNKISRSTSLG